MGGKGNSLMKLAERDFEDCRQRMLELAARSAGARAGPAVEYLETRLANVTADYKSTKQMDHEVGYEVAKMRDLYAAAEAKRLQGEKDMKSCLNKSALARDSMKKKQASVLEMKKEVAQVKTELQKTLARSQALDGPLLEAT